MKKVTMYALMAFLSLSCFGQRHLKGSKIVGLDGGITKFGYFGGLSFSYMVSAKSAITIDGVMEVDRNKSGETLNDFQALYGSLAFFYTPVDINSKIYFNVGLGIAGNFTSQTGSNYNGVTGEFEETTNKYQDYGVFLSPEVEFYIVDQFSVFLNARQFWFPTDEIGDFVFFGGGGVKLNLSALGAKAKYD